jgi:hypothetical protein
MTYSKPKVIAKNHPSGVFSAGCAGASGGPLGTCIKRCEIKN